MDIQTLNAPAVLTIKKVMDEKGYKQRFVAEQIGLSEQAFCDLLNGRRVMKISEVVPIVKVLGITPNDLFSHNDQKGA